VPVGALFLVIAALLVLVSAFGRPDESDTAD
jgi:hypothetical protein